MEENGRIALAGAELNEFRGRLKALLNEFFWGAIRSLIILTLSVTLLFTLMALVIHEYGVQEQDISQGIRMVESALLFPVYLAMGLLCGFVYAAAATIKRNVDLLEQGVHDIADPLMERIIGLTPAHGMQMDIDAFKKTLEKGILEYSALAKSGNRIFSMAGIMISFFQRNVLRIMKYAMVNDFLASLEKSGKNTVSIKEVESYARERMIGRITSLFRARVDLVQYACYAAALLFSLPPLIAYLF